MKGALRRAIGIFGCGNYGLRRGCAPHREAPASRAASELALLNWTLVPRKKVGRPWPSPIQALQQSNWRDLRTSSCFPEVARSTVDENNQQREYPLPEREPPEPEAVTGTKASTRDRD